MVSLLKKNLPSVNSRFIVKGLLLTVLVYLFFLSVFIFADESADLWNSNTVSAAVALGLTLISIMQLLILFYIFSLSAKTSRIVRNIQDLGTSNEEILISIQALGSALNALNVQKLDS